MQDHVAWLPPASCLVLDQDADMDAPTASVGDPPDLLHVHVDHVPGPGPFIVAQFLAKIDAVGAVLPQPVDSPTKQDPVDR